MSPWARAGRPCGPLPAIPVGPTLSPDILSNLRTELLPPPSPGTPNRPVTDQGNASPMTVIKASAPSLRADLGPSGSRSCVITDPAVQRPRVAQGQTRISAP